MSFAQSSELSSSFPSFFLAVHSFIHTRFPFSLRPVQRATCGAEAATQRNAELSKLSVLVSAGLVLAFFFGQADVYRHKRDASYYERHGHLILSSRLIKVGASM